MDIDLLNEFVTLTKCLNYSKAAEQLYISQSVLSRHIQSLETRLGVELLARSKHSVSLTPIGEIFAADAEKVIGMYEKAIEHVQMSKDGSLGTFELTTSYALSSLFLYEFLPKFNRKYPNIKAKINIQEVGVGTKKAIEDQVTDMAILMDWTENSSPLIEHEPFFRNSFYAFIPNGHPLYDKDSVTIQELSGLPMVYLSGPENQCSTAYFQKLFEKHHAVYNPCIAASGTEDIFLKILTEHSVSILSETVFRFTPSKIRPIKISDVDAYINTNLIWNKENTNPCIRVFAREFDIFARAYNKKNSKRS